LLFFKFSVAYKVQYPVILFYYARFHVFLRLTNNAYFSTHHTNQLMSEFSNEPINIDLLPKYERVPLTLLHKKYWNIILINLFLFLLFVAILAGFIYAFNEVRISYLYMFTAFYVCFAGLLIYLNRIAFKRRGFAIRERDIIFQSGIISISSTIVPFNRIQHIALEEGVLSRIYHLGSLQIFTAGGNSGSLHIPGIQIDQARTVKELLMQQIKIND
jgi:membrane protein YdbS with pleckstrin-like domain